MIVYTTLKNYFGNILASIDFETSGSVPGYHEVLQFSVVPLDENLEPFGKPFNHYIAPRYPHRADPAAMDAHMLSISELQRKYPEEDVVLRMFDKWWRAFELPENKRLVPLVHNWTTEGGFMIDIMGIELMQGYFDARVRDTMTMASCINDMFEFRGHDAPFKNVKLGTICDYFGVVNPDPHNAYCDAVATGECYKHMLTMEIPS